MARWVQIGTVALAWFSLPSGMCMNMPTISWTWALELLRKEFLWLRLACKEEIWVRSKGYSTSMSEYLQTISIFQLLSLETSGGYWKQHYSFPLPDMQVLGRNHIHLKIKVKVLLNLHCIDIQTVVTGAVEATLTRSTTSPKAALLAGTNAVDLAVFSSNVQHASKTKHRQVRIAHHLLAKELRTWNWCYNDNVRWKNSLSRQILCQSLGSSDRQHCTYHQGYTEGSSIGGWWFEALTGTRE